ncbi:MAG: S8 family serine peptidase, partial [Cyclobacteriaceae bacterium]
NNKSGASSIVSPNEVVVRYHDSSITELDKQLIRASYQEEYHFLITEVETCSCDIKDVELWRIDTSHPDFTSIEDLVRGLKNDEDDDDMDGDYQFVITILDGDESVPLQLDLRLEERVVDTNDPDAMTVAIIDTGIDYNFLPEPVLYNSGINPGCSDEVSGWDFVNDDFDPMDDDSHGTLVARVIQNELEYSETPYNILAVKAFDENGRGSYFNTVCALSYIKRNNDVDVVNMSFGWKEVTNTSIMQTLISEMDESVLFIGSAGNDGIDTDVDGNEHFPSGYVANNLITVAGFSPSEHVMMGLHDNGTVSGLVLDQFSNYGATSIDVAASFSYDLAFQSGLTNLTITTDGTSYSSAFVAGRAARLKFSNQAVSPLQVKGHVIRTGYSSSSLQGKTTTRVAVLGSLDSSGPSMHILR